MESTVHRILFIGSNPSNASQTTHPFSATTKSGKTLKEWIERLDISCRCLYCNVSDIKTVSNRPLTTKEIKNNLEHLKDKINQSGCTHVVAVGRTAEKALTLLRANFYVLPHPSGLNRQLNDPKIIEEKINGLREFLTRSSDN